MSTLHKPQISSTFHHNFCKESGRKESWGVGDVSRHMYSESDKYVKKNSITNSERIYGKKYSRENQAESHNNGIMKTNILNIQSKAYSEILCSKI
jgi:uncharacterized phage-associated protein